MLNSKLVRISLFLNGFLLFIVFSAFAGTQNPGDSLQQKRSDSTIQWMEFDEQLLVVTGLPETEIASMPIITMNTQAAKYVNDYIVRNEKTLDRIKQKSASPFNAMDAIFAKYNLPIELKYLAVVESELKTTALSRVGARGLWQLMPTTARDFKLKVGSKYDERTHLYKSTVAAARYLHYLHGLFDDWLLAIAAYNAGPGSVYKAIKKSGSRNFWKLQNFLPAETRGHVKKFIGTHYYFEGAGGVTTLTKDEAQIYSRKMIAFVAEQNLLLAERMVTKVPEQVPSTVPASEGAAVVKNVSLGEMRVDEEE